MRLPVSQESGPTQGFMRLRAAGLHWPKCAGPQAVPAEWAMGESHVQAEGVLAPESLAEPAELECASCAESLPRECFSGSQWRKGDRARCKTCIRAAKDPPEIVDPRLRAFVDECRAAKEEYKQSQTEIISRVNSWIWLGGALRQPSLDLHEAGGMICAAVERNITPVLRELFPVERRLVLNLDDKGSEQDWPEALDSAVLFARDARRQDDRPLYVFCALGCNRSVVVVVALLMAIEEMSLDAALQLVRAQRPCIRPKYVRVLAEYEVRLGRESSRPEFLDAPDSKSFGALF